MRALVDGDIVVYRGAASAEKEEQWVALARADQMIQDILAEPNKLLLNPEISQREELLLDRENEYRYLVCKNYKIIYSVNTNAKQIKIADVFDSRQNPINIKRTK